MIKDESEKANVETLQSHDSSSRSGSSVSEPLILRRSKRLKTDSVNLQHDKCGLNLSTPLDLTKLLSLDAPMRECLLPNLSFKDLASLEMTSQACRNIIASKHFWKNKVDNFILKDKQASRLFSRYSKHINTSSPNYHKRLTQKLHTDLRGVKQNLKLQRCRKATMSFPVEKTCHRAYDVTNNQTHHGEGEALMFILQDTTIEVLTTTQSMRGTALKHHKSFQCFQSEHTCTQLKVYEEFLFHLTNNQLTIWNWKEGTQVRVPSLDQNDVVGMGVVVMLSVKEGHLIIGTNGNAFGNAGTLVQIWTFTYPDLMFTPVTKIEEPDESPMKGNVAFDLHGHLVCLGYGSGHSGPGKLVLYDLKTKKAFNEVSFQIPVTEVLVNAEQRRVLVGFLRGLSQEPSVKMLDADSGNVLQEFTSTTWAVRCLWTDWREYVMCGDDGGLLVWDMQSGDATSSPMVNLNGCNGLPLHDRVFHVFFDGFHLFVYTRGSTKSTVRVLDFLSLSSVRF